MAPSSQNEFGGDPPSLSVRNLLCLSWAFGLVLAVLLNATLLVDTSAFVRFATIWDPLGGAWASAAFGYVGIIAIAAKPDASRPRRGNATETTGWAILSLLGYTTHLFLMRWPWLSGTAEVGSRLNEWSATLSSTVEGIPWRAFAELLCLAVLVVHAFVGALSATGWQRFENLSRLGRLAYFSLALLIYALASCVVVALATGRR